MNDVKKLAAEAVAAMPEPDEPEWKWFREGEQVVVKGYLLRVTHVRPGVLKLKLVKNDHNHNHNHNH